MKKNKKKRVIVAISGGVDSAVAAFMLQKKGYEVIGVFMRLGVDQGNAEDAARRICQKLNIKFYPFNVAPNFKKEVIKYFLDSYEAGFTPNPCVQCNRVIKFGELLKLADQLGAEYLATGHYIRRRRKIRISRFDSARRANFEFRMKLLKGIDQGKDQSYFLYNLTQDQLKRILFPLGKFTKEEIKKIAGKNNLPVQSSESQDICFLSGDHNDFLKDKIKLTPGKIKTLAGEVVGEHKGLPLYTVGQRRGVDIGGIGPFYVVRADYDKNILYVTKDKDDKELYRDEFVVENVNWVSGENPKLPFKCEVVIRYRHKAVACVVTKEQGNALFVRLDKAERAITAGQSAVFYRGDEVIGGGTISIKN